MIVAVTGGTGFTGEFVVRRLLAEGHAVRCLVRPHRASRLLPQDVEQVAGSLEQPEALERLLNGADTFVKVSSLGFGHAEGAIRACVASGVGRAIFFSTSSIFTKVKSVSGPIRKHAETQVRSSGLRWTILRPTMIYGNERDRNMSRLIRFLHRTHIVPLPGGGRGLIQPVYVQDLADAVAAVVSNPRTEGREYNLPGANASPVRDLVSYVLGLLGRRAALVTIPLRPAAGLAGLWTRTGLPPHIRGEQVLRLAEDKAFSYEEAQTDFGYRPRTWQDGLRAEVRHLRGLGLIQ